MPTETQWRADVAKVMSGSEDFIDHRTAGKHGKLAINFDIDNSSLATFYRKGTAIPEVLSFALHAHDKGVAILFNTARYGKNLTRARALLTNAGYPVTALCGRTSRSERLAHGKQRCRKAFVKKGYTLIANVGNNTTDFSGPRNYEVVYRLPNYGKRLS
jgi:hypothetical protein